MGTNRRYADKVTRRMANRAAEGDVTGDPLSLGAAELAPEVYPVTVGRGPVWVRAWVRYPGRAVRVEAQAITWTDRAVQVQREGAGGRVRTAWVWHPPSTGWPRRRLWTASRRLPAPSRAPQP